MRRLALFLLAVTLATAMAATGLAGEIDYIEDFALADDRTVPLEQLIPGTEDHYYYHALHYQNNGQYDRVDALLGPWIKEHKYTPRVREILNRQALLKYEQEPAKSLEYIREQLGIHFNHQKEILGQKPDLPTSLDQKLISRETLSKRAFARYSNVEGFLDAALDWLVADELNPARRRHLLSRLARPDYPNLVQLVVDDLNYKDSRGFGSLAIHKQLLLAQLDECLEKEPDLLNQTHFVTTYLSKLRPDDDADMSHDPEIREAYLDRLWQFIQRLAPVHNSLKANVLYHRLVHDRAQGTYDRERLMTYVKLPRGVSYINAEFMRRDESRRFVANLNANYSNVTLLPPVGNDEPLVRSYLHHFFIADKDYKAFEPYVNDLYLKHNFAETKIVNGIGDQQQWYAMLPAAQYKALKDRIDLDFASTNKQNFAAGEPVSLDLNVKNVQTLIVKVFEINTQNFYRQKLVEVDTDINLDGLVANEETTHQYEEPPLRRMARHFDFPTLKRPGVYVIDFIGNGKSSRALVRKGKLHYLVRMSTAGQVFTVLDEDNRKVSKPTIYLAGHEYQADKDGTITVPYSTNPGQQPIVLGGNGIHSLDHFVHEAESYSLQAGMYVDREMLLSRKKAQLVVRPTLTVNSTPVTLSVLEDVRLVLVSTDHDGITTTKEVADFKLFEDRESLYEFQVPQRLGSIGFVLHAKVQNLSQNKKIDLSASELLNLNAIDRSDKIEDLHFAKIDGSYVIDLLGKTGEPKPDRPVQLVLRHRDFKETVNLSLQTDSAGRVALGALEDISVVTATGPQGTAHNWSLIPDSHTYRRALHGKAGETVEVPYMEKLDKPARTELSLLELRGNTFVADRFEALSIDEGLLEISDLPPGDYDLLLKRSGTHIRVRLTEGAKEAGYVLGENRQLEVRGDRPLQIADVEVDDEAIGVQLKHASKFARVHVFATRFHTGQPFGQLSRGANPEPYVIVPSKAQSVYLAGRNIGDEYRYIIDRKYAVKYPGNMLGRPELLLNPWAIRSTEAGKQDAEAGEEMDAAGGAGRSSLSRHGGAAGSARGQDAFANLDFLAQGSTVLLNLVPNKEGLVKIARKDLGPHQQVYVVAVDPRNTVGRFLSLPEVKIAPRDLRLADGLDPKIHFTQQKQISLIEKGSQFELADVTSSKFEAYDSLPKVYSLLATLNGDAKLVEFSFILNWHKMTDEEKREKYSKYACHELSFFLYKKDSTFFKEAIRPYLSNKRDKTFLDQWLLEEDLSGYLQPWAHARLNIVEQILLAQRIDEERQRTSRHVVDLFDLIPPNVEQFNRLFDTALESSSMDTDDKFGLIDAVEKSSGVRRFSRAAKSPAAPPAPATAPALAVTDAPATLTLEAAPAEAPAMDALSEPEPEAERKLEEAGKSLGLERAARKRRAGDVARGYFDVDGDKRGGVRQLYRKLDKTQEWVENNYYKLPIEQQTAKLITVNAFWRDYADSEPGKPFRSTNLAEASRSFPEMMFALALLGVPAEADEHESDIEGTTMTLTAGGPMIVFHQAIKEAKSVAEETPILVSQNFFRHGDRYRHEGNEKIDKFITDEFLVHTVYGCQVVLTNPTSSRQKLSVLLQVPAGAMAVSGGKLTRTLHIDLQPYNTQAAEYYFYFPAAGDFAHYPVHVAKNEQLLANAEPFTFHVVEEPSQIDRESWDHVSQHGTDDQVLAYLKEHNLNRTNLEKIAFRMADKEFFETVTSRLATRHVYNQTLWSYAIKHDMAAAVREYLQHSNGFVNVCGAHIESPLLVIDPVARHAYQHMEYSPLVNARAHQLGRRRQIVNERMSAQYHRLLKILAYRKALDHDDLMALTYYMLLQDRVEEAIGFFERVDAKKLDTRLQHDYFAAYLDFYTDDHKLARKITDRYADYPVDRWRNAFADVAAQLDEIEGAETEVIDDEDRTQQQTGLAASQPSFDFQVESKQIALSYQNLDEVRINYYLMDIELLFSQNPFVKKYSSQFSHIRPNSTETVSLSDEETSVSVPLPEKFHNRNVLVEILGEGQTKSQAYYSNSMAVQVIENYGHIRVAKAEGGKPLPKVYVKVYAQMKDGQVQFYKDGYTDLRGRFDFTSLNTNELDFVAKFSLLILSEQHGAIVKEANPPKR